MFIDVRTHPEYFLEFGCFISAPGVQEKIFPDKLELLYTGEHLEPLALF